MKRLRQLEHENQRLKKMVADRDLELDVLKEITRKNGSARVRRQQVAGTPRGCPAAARITGLGIARSTLTFQHVMLATVCFPCANYHPEDTG